MRRIWGEIRAMVATELVGLAVRVDAVQVYKIARVLVAAANERRRP